MWLIIGIVVVLLVLVIGAAVWFLAPTMRSFGGPDFEPTPKDDASVEKANNTWTITGGGAGG
jgi:hypothetical protein